MLTSQCLPSRWSEPRSLPIARKKNRAWLLQTESKPKEHKPCSGRHRRCVWQQGRYSRPSKVRRCRKVSASRQVLIERSAINQSVPGQTRLQTKDIQHLPLIFLRWPFCSCNMVRRPVTHRVCQHGVNPPGVLGNWPPGRHRTLNETQAIARSRAPRGHANLQSALQQLQDFKLLPAQMLAPLPFINRASPQALKLPSR